MENFIDHDSLHRVEPTARHLSEAIAKTDADAAALLKSHMDAAETRENMALESESGNNVENDEENKKNQNPQPEKNPHEKVTKKNIQKENFMGGQLFDADA